ncbi:hypothetical protein DERP_005995 [Dermatophagoides pteronyssinus]|uniref:Uncharacterized protein n=1 Tax=Dermatophagoides pteronyssinus TaxID=6956 RepID=A0ABQ8JSL9_DERPT|nr:hypothetical protein DERP_005995 [Dermatophagoides pteronyssinus]
MVFCNKKRKKGDKYMLEVFLFFDEQDNDDDEFKLAGNDCGESNVIVEFNDIVSESVCKFNTIGSANGDIPPSQSIGCRIFVDNGNESVLMNAHLCN